MKENPELQKRGRGRPKKPKKELNPNEKFDLKISKKLANAKRELNRFRIQAVTEDGVNLYYVDHLVFWSLNKSKALQIYGKQYAEELAARIAKEPPRYEGLRKFISVKAKRISVKYTDEKYYMENVYGDDVYFRRGYVKQYKKSEKQAKRDRLKKLKAGDYKNLSERDIKLLKESEDKARHSREQRNNRTNARRDKRRIRIDYDDED